MEHFKIHIRKIFKIFILHKLKRTVKRHISQLVKARQPCCTTPGQLFTLYCAKNVNGGPGIVLYDSNYLLSQTPQVQNVSSAFTRLGKYIKLCLGFLSYKLAVIPNSSECYED